MAIDQWTESIYHAASTTASEYRCSSAWVVNHLLATLNMVQGVRATWSPLHSLPSPRHHRLSKAPHTHLAPTALLVPIRRPRTALRQRSARPSRPATTTSTAFTFSIRGGGTSTSEWACRGGGTSTSGPRPPSGTFHTICKPGAETADNVMTSRDPPRSTTVGGFKGTHGSCRRSV